MSSSRISIGFLVVAVVFSLLFLWVWVFSGSPSSLVIATQDQFGSYVLDTPLPLPRTEAGSIACRGKFYIAGGIDWRARTISSFQSYDPQTKTWTSLPDLPEPLSHAALLTDGEQIFVVGGFGPLGIRLRWFMFAEWNPRSTVFIFDPSTARWSKGEPMPEPRGAGGATFASGALWYAGGINQQRQISADLFRFDLATRRWQRMPSMAVPRDHLRMEAVDNRLYAISGRKDDLRLNLANVESYDIATGQWSRKSDIPIARGGFGSAVVDGFIYTFGGEMTWHCLDSIERYDPRTDRWTAGGKLPEGRHGIMAGVIGNRIHMVSGGRHPRISISGIHRVFTPAPSSAAGGAR